MSTHDRSAVRDRLFSELLTHAQKCGRLTRLTDDRKSARKVFCILLETQLCFYSDNSPTARLLGRLILDR